MEILPTSNITTTEVGNILSTSSRDIGVLCTNHTINMWSKHKPVRDPRISVPLNEVGKGSDNRWGLNIPSYVNGSYPLTTYIRPGTWVDKTGQHKTPFRLGDFRGYCHGNLTPPVTIGPKPAQIETTSLGTNGVIYLQSQVMLGAPLIGLHDLGLRVCAMFYISGTNTLVGWASAPDDTNGFGASYIAYQLTSQTMTLDIKFSLVQSYHPWSTKAIPTDLSMWEIPRQFPGQNGDWIGVPLVLGAKSISNYSVLGYTGEQKLYYSITANYSFTAVIEIIEEGRTSGLWYKIQGIPVVANVAKSAYIYQSSLSYQLISGKKYTTNLYDAGTLKFSREMVVGP